MVVQLNDDAFRMIAELMDPDPHVFYKLMWVNKSFFKIFSQDKLWRKLNVYGLRKQLWRNYLGYLSHWANQDEDVPTVWQEVDRLAPEIEAKLQAMGPMGLLCYLMSLDVCRQITPLVRDSQYFDEIATCLMQLKPESIQWFIEFESDIEKARYAVGACGCSLRHFVAWPRKEPEIQRLAIETGCNRFCHLMVRRDVCHSPLTFVDPDFRMTHELKLLALRNCGLSLENILPRMRRDDKHFHEYVTLGLQQNPLALQCVPHDMITEQYIHLSVGRDSAAAAYLPQTPEFAQLALDAFEKGFLKVDFIRYCRTWRDQEEFIEEACNVNYYAYIQGSTRYRRSPHGRRMAQRARVLRERHFDPDTEQ